MGNIKDLMNELEDRNNSTETTQFLRRTTDTDENEEEHAIFPSVKGKIATKQPKKKKKKNKHANRRRRKKNKNCNETRLK